MDSFESRMNPRFLAESEKGMLWEPRVTEWVREMVEGFKEDKKGKRRASVLSSFRDSQLQTILRNNMRKQLPDSITGQSLTELSHWVESLIFEMVTFLWYYWNRHTRVREPVPILGHTSLSSCFGKPCGHFTHTMMWHIVTVHIDHNTLTHTHMHMAHTICTHGMHAHARTHCCVSVLALTQWVRRDELHTQTHTHTHFSEPGQRWQVIKPELFYIGIVSSNTFHLGGRMSSSPCFWHLVSNFNMTLLVHAAGLFWCFHSPSNSDMDFRIFNVHM